MRFRHPLIAILAGAILVASIGTGLMFVESIKKQNRVSRRNDVTRMLEAVRSWSEVLNRSLGDRLNHFLETEFNSPEPTPAFLASEFQALALMTEADGGNWNVDWWRTRVSTLDQTWVAQQFKDSKWLSMKGREVYWERLVLPGGQVVFAIASPMEIKDGEIIKNKVAIGFTTPGLFSMSQFANAGDSSGEIFVVDQKGNAVGYPEAQYVGSKIDSHPLVAELIRSPAAQKVHEYSVSDDKKSVGGYEHVSDSNLYVVSSYPLPNSNELISAFLLQALAIVLAIIAFASTVAAFVLGREWRTKRILEQNLELSTQPIAAAAAVAPSTIKPIENNQNSKLSADTIEFAKSIGEFLRAPVTALLGYVQMLDDHLTSPGSLALGKQLTEETRVIRDFVEAMAKEAQISEQRLEAVPVQSMLSSVVAMKKADYTKAQISLEENFQTDVRVKADFVRLKSSVLVLLNYAGEFLAESTGVKRVVISVEKMGGVAQIKIEVRGRDLSAELRKKLFLPFQVKTKARGQMGLDLALVRTRITDMHGELTADLIGIEGFQILIKVPTAIEGMTAITRPLDVPTAPAASSTIVAGSTLPTPADAQKEEKAKTIPLPKDFQQIRTDFKFKLDEKLVDDSVSTKLPPPPDDAPPTDEVSVVRSNIHSIGNDKQPINSVQIRKPKVGSDS